MLGKAGSSKNMTKFFVFLLVVICLGMGAGVVYMKSSEDNEGPKITFEEGKDTNYTSDMTEEDLLKGVKAQDDRDGDVTDSLTVETIYPKNDGKQVSVIFVAKDKNNNVTKKEFTMEAQDGSAENPQLGLIDNDGLPEDGDSTDTTEPAEETDMQDGTEADSTDAESGDSTEGELTPEEQAQKTQEDKIEQLSPQDPKMYLTTYYVEVPVGTTLDKLSYVKDIQDDTESTSDLFKRIQITGDVNTAAPGTYELTYYVVDNSGNSSNGAVLTIVVK